MDEHSPQFELGADENRQHHDHHRHPATDPATRNLMVSIVWKDAESQGGPTWEDRAEMMEFAQRPLTTVHTVGLLLHVDDEQVAITDTLTTDQMGGVTKIPRGWIEKIEYLAPSGDLDTGMIQDESTRTPSSGGEEDSLRVG